MHSSRWKNTVWNFTRKFPTLNSYLSGFPGEAYWSWTILWKKEGTTNECGSVYQTFASSKHHSDVSVSRHVSTQQIRQEYFQERPLHHSLQESPRSIGHAKFIVSSLSHTMVGRARHISESDRTTFWLHAIGFTSQERRSTDPQSSIKGRGLCIVIN